MQNYDILVFVCEYNLPQCDFYITIVCFLLSVYLFVYKVSFTRRKKDVLTEPFLVCAFLFM